MNARMGNPAIVLPDAMAALLALSKAVAATGIPATTVELVNLRVSQINGCAVCLHMHARDLRKAGLADEKIDTVAGWHDAPWFSEAERAALALAESVTRIADRADPVPDAVFQEAARHYDERQLSALILAIANINVWNRVNISVRQVAGGAW
ncbi:carboxymuconolactone decarboxylase family protein [Kitasatospora nipponensis]|uniref:Carboxymuconolactone decarboxylase family protein n=1 Tax=Kitasatospora nipponensis TaxID=258049 RepID=A0ABP4HBI0_9ACTN